LSKPEWGVKRTCQSCAARFYDLKRTPIVCPKCGHKHDVEDFVKTRRTRGAAAKAAPPPPPKKTPDKAVPAELDDTIDVETDDEADDDMLEDTADLGEDGDDIPEVESSDDETTS